MNITYSEIGYILTIISMASFGFAAVLLIKQGIGEALDVVAALRRSKQQEVPASFREAAARWRGRVAQGEFGRA